MTPAQRTFRYFVVGVIGFVVDAGVLALLIGTLGPYAARVASFLAAVAMTWAINRRYTFVDRSSGRSGHVEFAAYLAVMLSGGAINYAIYALFIALSWFGPAGPYVGVAAGSLCGMASNLLLSHLLVFRHGRAD